MEGVTDAPVTDDPQQAAKIEEYVLELEKDQEEWYAEVAAQNRAQQERRLARRREFCEL